MDRLLTAADVAETLRVSVRTAYVYMAQMPHLNSPRRVSQQHLKEWIISKTVLPPEKNPPGMPRRRAVCTKIDRIPMRKESGR